MKISQTQEELEEHLKDQLNFLKSSCHAFDLGFENEARRIAVILRILLSDSKNSKSLLTILELKQKIPFYTWMSDERRIQERKNQEKGKVLHFRLGVATDFSPNGVRFAPRFVTVAYFKVSFEEWWNEIIFKVGDFILTRGEIILSVADNDGGAHVDKQLKEGYFRFSRNQNVNASQGVVEFKLNSPAYVAVRQFAYELEKSFSAI